jgi:hypothetical protein
VAGAIGRGATIAPVTAAGLPGIVLGMDIHIKPGNIE